MMTCNVNKATTGCIPVYVIYNNKIEKEKQFDIKENCGFSQKTNQSYIL